MTEQKSEFPYPRRRIVRSVMRRLIDLAFTTLTDFRVIGQENLPEQGPLIVVANHFSFIDPVAVIRVAPWPIEFLGGFQLPNAPPVVTWIPKLWGYYPVFRGTGSRYALQASEAILNQKGVIGIFPEGGSWATVLRPARPGTAFLATRTQAPILPIGLDGMPKVFPMAAARQARAGNGADRQAVRAVHGGGQGARAARAPRGHRARDHAAHRRAYPAGDAGLLLARPRDPRGGKGHRDLPLG